MNKFIERVNAIDAQLTKIDKILKAGEYGAAGLSIDICVGPRSDEHYSDVRVELCSFTTEILRAVQRSLEDSRMINIAWAKSEHKELESFLLFALQKGLL